MVMKKTVLELGQKEIFESIVSRRRAKLQDKTTTSKHRLKLPAIEDKHLPSEQLSARKKPAAVLPSLVQVKMISKDDMQITRGKRKASNKRLEEDDGEITMVFYNRLVDDPLYQDLGINVQTLKDQMLLSSESESSHIPDARLRLALKVHNLRSNPFAVEELHKKAETYLISKNGGKTSEAIERNRSDISQSHSPTAKQHRILEKASELKDRIEKAQERQRILDEEKKYKIIHDASNREARKQMRTLQRRWLSLILMTRAMSRLSKSAELQLRDRRIMVLHKQSIHRIQNCWRRHKSRLRRQRLFKFRVGVHCMLFIRRSRLPHRSANILRIFLFEQIFLQKKLNRAAKMMRFRAIKIQRAVRRYLLMQRARIDLVVRYWFKIERQTLQKQKDDAKINEQQRDFYREKVLPDIERMRRDLSSDMEFVDDILKRVKRVSIQPRIRLVTTAALNKRKEARDRLIAERLEDSPDVVTEAEMRTMGMWTSPAGSQRSLADLSSSISATNSAVDSEKWFKTPQVRSNGPDPPADSIARLKNRIDSIYLSASSTVKIAEYTADLAKTETRKDLPWVRPYKYYQPEDFTSVVTGKIRMKLILHNFYFRYRKHVVAYVRWKKICERMSHSPSHSPSKLNLQSTSKQRSHMFLPPKPRFYPIPPIDRMRQLIRTGIQQSIQTQVKERRQNLNQQSSPSHAGSEQNWHERQNQVFIR
eukprot:GILJ01003884.1.p1 GENE.GILJ01003884.1~~GILJ01003884.1.p1  ORF type:complete len:707 (-),score=140.94 GILJ01003884.1:174-2294(-)